MAFRPMTYLENMASRIGGTHPRARFGTSATPVYTSPNLTGAGGARAERQPSSKSKLAIKGDYVPVYVVRGFIMVVWFFGVHTAMQQLRYSPNVQVSKKEREELPEVDEPDYVVDEADKFLKNSFFRKVAQIQDYDRNENIINPIHGDVFNRRAKVETLKSVGLEPKRPVSEDPRRH